MKSLFAITMLLWAAVSAAPAAAQSNPVVVELFTSQGCSACPPADDMLRQLTHRDDVIALALHVDYWDYIGWKDIFASPANTERQKSYALAAGRRSVYTPQMIINGTDAVMGAKGMVLADHISNHARLPAQVILSLRRSGDDLSITAQLADGAPREKMIVQLVRFAPERSVDITRGENAGHHMTYFNVVTAMNIVAEWDGRAPLSLTTPAPGADPAAVLVQYAGHGPIVAAAQLD